MDARRQRLTARLLLLLGVACGIGWLATLDLSHKISTDLLDLIPRDEREPELMFARELATAAHARVAMFVLRAPDEADREAATAAFVASLRAAPEFAEIMTMGDTAAPDALARHLFEHRLDLLGPGWLARRHADWEAAGRPAPWAAWLAETTAARLEAFLARPEAMAFQDLIPADPLLLVPDLVAQVQALAQDPEEIAGRSLIWVRTRDDPLDESAQAPVIAAVDTALAAAHAIEPATTLQWAAISRFAAENRQRIRGELESLNFISFGAVLLVAAVGLRRLYSALHLAPVLLCAVLAAWVGATAAFERVHVLVFVIGSLLGGVAIDYGFYLQLQPPLHLGESYTAKVRRLLKPLLSSALTTVLGFLLLVVSDLPLIRQLGVFISAGLLGALAAALLWFGQMKTAQAEARGFLLRAWDPQRDLGRRIRVAALCAAAGVALVGPWFVRWHDDIRELEALPAAMRAEAEEVRALFGQGPGRTLYITRGATPAEARAALGRFLAEHAAHHPEASAASLGLALPNPDDHTAVVSHRRELADFPARLHEALARHGFEAEAFTPFVEAWTAWLASPPCGYDALVAGLHGALRGALALSFSTEPGASWFATVVDGAPTAFAPKDGATIALNRLESLNDLFTRYRISALRLSCLGLGLVGASVLAIYGLRRGWRIFLLPVGSCLLAFGVLGLLGQPLNLFHLLGAFLGVCLSHNYAIFTAENARWSDHPAPSVRLSALTTAVSFGVLAFSRIPVVAALGSTVALIVAAALLLVELAPPTARLPRGASRA
ncbi:MAG: MMPL family transporter [Opitutaceae bacterium]|nr:MMPL family transporter [Opitutaceae bacterium]